MLEGGYQIGGEFTSAFAKSVAAHVNSLAHGAASVRGYDLNLNEKEKDVEQKVHSTIFSCLLTVSLFA